MKTPNKKRYSVGRRVLVGMGMLPVTIKSVAEVPSVMGEYVHEVLVDGRKEVQRVLGCEIHRIPDFDEDLQDVKSNTKLPNIHLHGDNSRVNLNSTDNSVNTTHPSLDQLFVRLREEGRSIPDETDRENVLARLDELENAQGSNEFLSAYQRFITSAAQYMTTFGPFIPVLSQMLSGH
jgi:hypothetical protein